MNHQLLQQIIALELELLEPAVRASSERLGQLIDDEFIEFGRSGKVYSKQTVLDDLPLENQQRVQFKAYGFEGCLLANDVVQLTFNGKSIIDDIYHDSLRTSIWRKNEQGWQMVYHQATPVTESGDS